MGFLDKAKDAAGKAKNKVDDLVEENAANIPDNVEKQYDKASDAADEHVSDDTPKHEQIIKGN